jgi:hypothetical protein
MPKKHELEFANFILRFGEDRKLLDLAEEIVIPAFTSDLERMGGESRHFFQDIRLVNLAMESEIEQSEPVIAVVGRYIKDTTVQREQVYNNDTDELIKDDESLRTSPSSIFVLVLNIHRLLYFAETKYAPTLTSFQTTIRHFLRAKYNDYMTTLYEERSNLRITKKQIYSEYEPPNLEVIPLSDGAGISQFIDRYDLLKTAQISLVTTNNELDNAGLLKQLRQSKDAVLSDVTTIRHHSPKGLSKGGVKAQVASAVSQGNAKVVLKGKDREGNKLEVTNDTFKIRRQIPDPPLTLNGIVKKCYEQFELLREAGAIRVGELLDDVSDKIEQIRNHRDL